MPSTITLITDFGLEDGHVGAMKGVIRSIAPEATILVTFSLSRPERRADGSIIAQVLVIDSFGNLTTNLPADWLALSHTWEIEIAGQRIRGLQRTFGDVAENQLIAFVDSEGFLAIALCNGNAARQLGAKEGDQVLLRPY